MKSEQFTILSPTKLFFKCAIPAAVTSVFGALYSVVDGFFVGRYLGEDALAAVNLIMPVLMIVGAISNMIATGSSVNISMLLGAKKREKASQVFSFSVWFIILLSLVLGLLGYISAEKCIKLIAPGASASAIECGTEYLKVYAVFAPLLQVYFAMDNYLRVCGREKLSMIIGVASQVLNVILDYVLIALLRKGVTWAAAASAASLALGSIVMLLLFTKKRMDVYYTKPELDTWAFVHILANGSSEFFSNISVSVMSIVLNLFLIKYGGTTAVAAFSIVMYVDGIIGMLNFGICDSLQPAISYCYGANEIVRMKAIFRMVMISTIAVSSAAFIFMHFAGPAVTEIFIKPGDEKLSEMSITAVKLFSFSYLVGWIDMCFSSYFTALDRPARSFVVAVFGTLIFPIVVLYIMTELYGLNGIWMMAMVSSVASGILTVVLAKTMKITVDDRESGISFRNLVK